MVIQENDFKLKHISNTCFFDLSFKKNDDFKIVAYGIPILSAIISIINFRIDRDNQDPITLKEYVEKYKIELDNLTTIFNNLSFDDVKSISENTK